MNLYMVFPWWYFFAAFALFIVCTIIMSKLSKHFLYLRGTAITKFSIMELEFPGAPESISNIVRGIDHLEPEIASKSKASLKANLRWDYLFMPGAYLSIFFLCMQIAKLIDEPGRILMVILAWMQFVAWLFDLLENYYLFHKIRKPYPARLSVHKRFRLMVSLKWAIASLGVVSGFSLLFYFWLIGKFREEFGYAGLLLAVLLTIALFISFIRAMRAVVAEKKS
jgi:hypothetical protein